MKKGLPKPVDCPAQLFVLDRMEPFCGFGRPTESGVYVVCLKKASGRKTTKPRECVMYVGSSANIKKRIGDPSHPYHKLREKYRFPYMVYVRTHLCDGYKEKEIQLIKLLQPHLNIQHNNG